MEKLDTKIILLACIGMFLSVLNYGNLNVALPLLEKIYHTSTTTVSWTVSIYVLVLSCTILLFGKLSDIFGKVYVYRYGFLLFFIGSLCCVASFNIGWLIFSRALQGIGAAIIQANAVGLMTSMLPEQKRVKALSLLGLAMGLGPILGPSLGGIIISITSWRWIFVINLPICIWGFLASKGINEDISNNKGQQLPVLQLGLFSFAVISFLLGLLKLVDHYLLAGLLISAAIIFTFLYLYVEKKTKTHVIPLSLFSDIYFSVPLIGIMIFGLCSAVIFILPPFLFENYLHFSSWKVGIIGLLCPFGFLIGSQLVPLINQRYSMEQSSFCGLVIMVISLFALFVAQIGMYLILFYLMLFLYGLGGAIFQIVSLNMMMKYQVTSLHGTVGAIIRMFQNITVALGTTLSAIFIQQLNKNEGIYGYVVTWLLAVILCFFATTLHAYFFKLKTENIKQT